MYLPATRTLTHVPPSCLHTDHSTLVGQHRCIAGFGLSIWAVLGLGCCSGFSPLVSSTGYSLFAVCWLLTEVASLVVGQGLWAHGLSSSVPGLWSTGSTVVAHDLSCSEACGIFSDQGLNPSPALAVDPLPLSHRGSPAFVF